MHQETIKSKKDTKSKMHSSFFYFFAALVAPVSALASGETPVSQGIGYITSAMSGATGIAIATVAVMVVGLLCLGHFIKWIMLGYTIIGISIIFGANAIVNGIVSLVR